MEENKSKQKKGCEFEKKMKLKRKNIMSEEIKKNKVLTVILRCLDGQYRWQEFEINLEKKEFLKNIYSGNFVACFSNNDLACDFCSHLNP